MGGLFSKFRRGGQRETGNGAQNEQGTLSRAHQSEPQLIDQPQDVAYKTDTLKSTKSEGGLLRGKKQPGKKDKGSSSTLDKSDDNLQPESQKAGVTTGSSSRSSTLDRNTKSASLPKGASLRGLFRSKSSTLKSTRSGGSRDSLDKKSKGQQQQAPSDDAQGNFLTRLLRRSSRELRKKRKEPAKEQRSKSEEKELLATAQSEQQNQETDDNLFKLRSSSEEPQAKAPGAASETPLLDTLQQDAASQNQDNADVIQERSLALKQTLSRSQELILEHQEKRKQFLMTKTITTTSTKSKETESSSTVILKKEETKDSAEEIIFEQKTQDEINKKAETKKQDIDIEDSYEIIDGQEVATSQQAGTELKADLERLQQEAQKIRGSDEALKPACDEFEVLQIRQNEKIDDQSLVPDTENLDNVVEDTHKMAPNVELSEDDKSSLAEATSTEKIEQTELFISEDVTSEEKKIPSLEEQEASRQSFEVHPDHPEISVNVADLADVVTKSHDETEPLIIHDEEGLGKDVSEGYSSELDNTEPSRHLPDTEITQSPETESELEDAPQHLSLPDTNKTDNVQSLTAGVTPIDDKSIKLNEEHFLESDAVHVSETESAISYPMEHDRTESRTSDSETAEQFVGKYTKTEFEMANKDDFEDILASQSEMTTLHEMDSTIVSAVEATGNEVQGTMTEQEMTVSKGDSQFGQNEDLEQTQLLLEESITPVCQSRDTEHEALPADVEASINKTVPVSDAFVDQNEVKMESSLDGLIQNVTENKTPEDELSTSLNAASVEDAEPQEEHDLEQELLATEDHTPSVAKCESPTKIDAEESHTSDTQLESSLAKLIPGSDSEIPSLEEQPSLEAATEAFQTVDEESEKGLDTMRLAENQSSLQFEAEERVTPADKHPDQIEATLQGEKLESPTSETSPDVQIDSSSNELIQKTEDKLDSHELSSQADNSSVDTHEVEEEKLEQVLFNASQLSNDTPVRDAEIVGDVPLIAQPESETEDILQEKQAQSLLAVETTSAAEIPEDTTAMLQQVVSDAYTKAIDEIKSSLVKDEERLPAETEITDDLQDLLQKQSAEDAMQDVQDKSQTTATDEELHHEQYNLAPGNETEKEEELHEPHEQTKVQKEAPIPVSPVVPMDQSFNLEEKVHEETMPSEMDAFGREAFDHGTIENIQADDLNVENQHTLSDLSPVEHEQDTQDKPVDYREMKLEDRKETTAEDTTTSEDAVHSVAPSEGVALEEDLQDVTNVEKQEDGIIQSTLLRAAADEQSDQVESGEHSEALEAESSNEEQEIKCAEKSSCLPHEFIWEHGGHDVYLCASFNNWMPIPLSVSDGVHRVTLEVPEGKHYYRYIVDDETTVNQSQVVEGDLNSIELKLAD